jgi:steroid 5-alpha reductase family enzyme
MSDFMQLSLTTLVALSGAMFVLWIFATVRRDVSLVDRFWGLGFIAVAWLSLLRAEHVSPRMILLTSLTTVWGLRLSFHLTVRNWGCGEDRRYAAMRRNQGSRFWWISLATVFGLQAWLMWIVSFPLQATAATDGAAPWKLVDLMGAALSIFGIAFETIADRQLALFQRDQRNAGCVLDRGLWRYSRHPNYFGDFCVWWGIYLVAAAGGAAWTVFSPIVMSILLMKVSGVTLLEQTITDRRPGYDEYRRWTNAFFPGPRKSVR